MNRYDSYSINQRKEARAKIIEIENRH